jgi:hypothetical protein
MGGGKPDAAREHFEDAVDLFLQSGAPFEVALARIELARALGDLGRIDAAVREARYAIDQLSHLNAEIEVGRAQRVLERLSETPDGKPTSPTSRSRGLTKREVQVLRLVAERPERSDDCRTSVLQRSYGSSPLGEHLEQAVRFDPRCHCGAYRS